MCERPLRCRYCRRGYWFKAPFPSRALLQSCLLVPVPDERGLAALVYCNSRVSLRLRVLEKRRAAGAVLPTEENGGWSGSRG